MVFVMCGVRYIHRKGYTHFSHMYTIHTLELIIFSSTTNSCLWFIPVTTIVLSSQTMLLSLWSYPFWIFPVGVDSGVSILLCCQMTNL